VEISGAFRIPDVMKQSGARLVEVGATNKVRLSDYEEALALGDGLVMHAHRSNFQIVGFTEEPALAELAKTAHAAGRLLVDDLGSGALLDTARFGLAHEPTVQESLSAGADIVCFSGDKLLGGPQAGVVVGRAELIQKITIFSAGITTSAKSPAAARKLIEYLSSRTAWSAIRHSGLEPISAGNRPDSHRIVGRPTR
jgi:L-seryl-tRNA(Ser) seleniumtransferase